jgi:hypothetical protein
MSYKILQELEEARRKDYVKLLRSKCLTCNIGYIHLWQGGSCEGLAWF